MKNRSRQLAGSHCSQTRFQDSVFLGNGIYQLIGKHLFFGWKQKHFEAMESEVNRMDHLIMEMLDLAKMSSGTYQAAIEVFDISETVRQVCSNYQKQVAEKNLCLEINVEPNMNQQYVKGHETLITRLLSNLINNAIRHTEVGHAVTISVKNVEREAAISIENEGQPLAKEDMPRIWDQFYRAGNGAGEGTGLGLAIAKEILILHQAPFGVENTERGVHFFFSLPIE